MQKIQVYARHKRYGKNEYTPGLPRRVCRYVFSIDIFCHLTREETREEPDGDGKWVRFSGFYKQGDGVIKVNPMKRRPRVDLTELKVGEILLPKNTSVILVKYEDIGYKSYSLTVESAPIVGISAWEAGYATSMVLGITVPKVFGLKILKDNCPLEETKLAFERNKVHDYENICRATCPKHLPDKDSRCLDCYSFAAAVWRDLEAGYEAKITRCCLERVLTDELEDIEAEVIVEF